MIISNLIKDIRSQLVIASSAKVANDLRIINQPLATLAVALPPEPIIKMGLQRSVATVNHANLEIVTCDACESFTPDEIGDGVGIGECHLGVKWTNELNNRRVPLYRYAQRHCAQFSKLI